jgi:hypothetical protein
MSLTAGLILGGVGGLGNLYAQYRAGRTARSGRKAYKGQMDDLFAGQRADIEGLLAPDAFRNYLDTAQGQSMVEQTRGQLQKNIQQLQGNVASAGGTDEARLAGVGALNRGYGDILNRIAAQGAQYQQGARQRLMSARQGLSDRKGAHAQNLYSMSQNRAQGLAQAGAGLGSAMTTMGGAVMDWGQHKNWMDVLGNQ